MKFTRWLTKHPKLTTRLTSLILITAFSIVAAIVLGLHPLIIVAIDLGIILAVYVTVLIIIASPIAKAERRLKEKCDPEPLISEMRFQLTTPKSEAAKREIALDLATALSDFGSDDEAIAIMDGLNKTISNETSETSFAHHFSYAVILHRGGRYEEAEIQYGLATDALSLIPEKKRSEATTAYLIPCAQHMLRNSDFQKCIDALESFPAPNLRDEIEAKLCLASAYISLGSREKSKILLDYIIANGNKLRYVNIAEHLLSKM